jgi:hypothetical protein
MNQQKLKRLQTFMANKDLAQFEVQSDLADALTNITMSAKGPKGDKGDRGMDGKDGRNGIDGKDGKDGKNGLDGLNGRDGAIGPKGDKGDKGDKGMDGVDGSPDTGDVIKFKLEMLKGDKRLDASAIKNLPIGGGMENFGPIGVQQIKAGTGISISPSNGVGVVTLSATGSISGSGVANELTYWTDVNTLGSLSTATYPSLTEFSYVKGVTSAIQTQINSKEPAITGSGANTVWHGDKTFSAVVEADISLSNNTTNNATISKHGFLPILSNVSSEFLNGQGNWSTPAAAAPNSYGTSTFTGTTITVTHNFGTYPNVQVLDSTKAVVVPLSIVNNTVNDFTVTFTSSGTYTILYTVGSPQPQAVTVASGNYTVLATDRIIKCTGAASTITLLTSVGNTGREFIINNTTTGDITVNTTSSQTISGQLTQVLPTNSSMAVYSDGADWFII